MKKSILRVAIFCAATALSACGRKPSPAVPVPGGAEAERPAAASAQEERLRRAEEERGRAELAREESRRAAVLTGMVFFGFDSYDIDEQGRRALEAKVPVLRGDPLLRLRIEGHADDQGSNEYNLVLGMRRANAARDYLGILGIAPERLSVTSYGEERPLERGSGEDARASNRRAEFRALGRAEAP
jgi:peptidoglycan-associated lipoprotein